MRLLGPSASVVVDTNIILSAVLGNKSFDTLVMVGTLRSLLGSAEMASETRLVIGKVMPERRLLLDTVIEAIEIIEPETYMANIDAACRSLRSAPASRNGSIRDAHILALAWTYDADIWSHDRDFAGTGWPSWSSANLAEALSEEAAASAAKTS
jgi:predicted nucleic acid-binding protein